MTPEIIAILHKINATGRTIGWIENNGIKIQISHPWKSALELEINAQSFNHDDIIQELISHFPSELRQ